MFRGWSQLYKGYDRSPILFDGMIDGRRRIFPRAAFYTETVESEFTRSGVDGSDEKRNRSLKVFNLGVDDEISRATMTVYQPIHKMQLDIAEDIERRDDHLDLFKSLRGIAVLTLSYLDKTVAAGLATTQEQVDSHVTNQLLKQLNWTSNKLANPERALLYKDIDEKVEACLQYGHAAFTRTGRINLPREGQICGQCTRLLPHTGKVGDGGVYDYCVCCAETVAGINYSVRQGTEMGANGTNEGANTSLVARLFHGFEGPTAVAQIPTEQRESYDAVIRNFRSMYGDVVFAKCDEFPYQPNTNGKNYDSPTCEDSKIEFRFPEYSVSDKISLFRDGLAARACNRNATIGTACGLTGVAVKEGICPAIKQILTEWPPTGTPTQTFRELWVQASMGRLLTGDDINNMFIMMGVQPGFLNGQWDAANHDITNFKDRTDISSRFKRFISVYCDAAAVSAFKKFHVRMMSISEDQLRVNQKATELEKGRLRDLLARASTQIELAERDLDASGVADRMLAGLDSEADRERVAQMGAAAEAQQAAMWNERMKNNITLWNWFRGSGSN